MVKGGGDEEGTIYRKKKCRSGEGHAHGLDPEVGEREQEMPSQPQGLRSEGLQLVRRWAVALKASLSSSRTSPARKQARRG